MLLAELRFGYVPFTQHANRSFLERSSQPTSALNMIIYKIFGPMAKDSYCEISEYFCIHTVEHLITNRQDRFLNRFRCQENYVCQTLIM